MLSMCAAPARTHRRHVWSCVPRCRSLASGHGLEGLHDRWVRVCRVMRQSVLTPSRTVWPSGLRRWLKAPFRKGVGSNPTAVTPGGWGAPSTSLEDVWHLATPALHLIALVKPVAKLDSGLTFAQAIPCIGSYSLTRPTMIQRLGSRPSNRSLPGPCHRVSNTVWPSGLRRWLKAPFRKGVGSNPTEVTPEC